MQNSFVVHVEDGKGDLHCPIDDFLLLDLPAPKTLSLLGDELVEVSSITELHDDVEPLSFDDGLAVGDDVDVFEFL